MNREELQQKFQNALVLAPLTKGGNLPFRRLCVDFGVDITYSEMVYARYLLKGEARERALTRRHPSEKCFGVQFAALQTDEALDAAKMVQDNGADFVDINCGCPTDDVTRKGLGAALLRRPKALFRLVEHLTANLSIPVTVKIRIGYKESEINAHEVARGVEEAGAAVLAVHGRTREQRYSRAADWKLIGELREQCRIPVVGNGDILTHYEAAARKELSGVAGLMIGRGALIKPWIYQEIKEQRDLNLSAEDRIAIYWKFVQYLKEHFRDDEKGRRRIMGFLPWHLELFSRYEFLPADRFAATAREHPLIQTRTGTRSELSELERLLASHDEQVHQTAAQSLLDSESPEDAVVRLQQAALVCGPAAVSGQGEDLKADIVRG